MSTLPPGPPLPRFLQTMAFVFAPAPFLDACRRRYGDVVTMGTLFDSKFVMVFDPEVVKQVFRGPPEQLRAGEANAPLGPVLGPRSVLLLDGAEHLRQRRLMLPAFHGERMRDYEQVMTAAADRTIDSWPVGETFTLLPAMQSLTLDVIMHAVFGVEEGAQQEELKRRVRAMLDPVGNRAAILMMMLSGGRMGVTGRIERFERQRRAVDEMIYAEIARRRDAADLEERTDVLSMLLLARDEDGEAMTDAELRDELVTLVVAGHETTATGLAWAFEELLRAPQVLARDAGGGGRRRHGLPRRRREGDAAPAHGRAGRRSRGARRAVPAERLHDPAGHRDQPLDRRDPPARRPLSRSDRVPPRALHRAGRSRHLHVDPVRRRHATLPGRQLRDVRDAGRDRARARAGEPRVGRAAGEGCAQGRHDRAPQGVRVRQTRAPRPASARALAEVS